MKDRLRFALGLTAVAIVLSASRPPKHVTTVEIDTSSKTGSIHTLLSHEVDTSPKTGRNAYPTPTPNPNSKESSKENSVDKNPHGDVYIATGIANSVITVNP